MIAAWAGSSAGVILTGTCIVLLWFAGRHSGRIHHRARPAVYRLIILGMYVGGCAIAVTALGGYVTGLERSLLSVAGGSGAAGHEIVVIGSAVVILAAALGAWLEPGPAVAWFALAVPFVVALAGGHEHSLLTVFPADQWSAQVSHWLGG